MVTIYIAIVCSKLPIPSHFKDFNVSVQIIFFLVLKSMFNRVKIQDVFINTSSLFIRKNTRITKHLGGNLIFFFIRGPVGTPSTIFQSYHPGTFKSFFYVKSALT